MELDAARLSESSTAGQFVNLSAREGDAPAEPHARMQGVLKAEAQPELHPPGCTDFPVGPSSQPRRIHKELCHIDLA